MTNHPELKACPFCGGKAIEYEQEWAKGIKFASCFGKIKEYACPANGSNIPIEVWNTRPAPVIIANMVEVDGYGGGSSNPTSSNKVPVINNDLREAIKAIRMSMQYGSKLSPIDIETLITHAMKGESK